MKRWLNRWRCRRWGHDWLLDQQREFVVVADLCMRCGEQAAWLPYGDCLGKHPIAEHYDDWGRPLVINCPGPW